MPKYRVETIFREVFVNIIKADNEKEAEQLAHNYLTTPVEETWEDSECYEVNDSEEADNE